MGNRIDEEILGPAGVLFFDFRCLGQSGFQGFYAGGQGKESGFRDCGLRMTA